MIIIDKNSVIFNGVEFDDSNKDEHGIWSQICGDCLKKHSIDKYHLDDHGSGICGVKGCQNDNESVVYIDILAK